MKLVEIKKTAIELSPDDWKKLASLQHDFDEICDSCSCPTCPLAKFCENHESPELFLKTLYNFLDD